MPRSCARRWRRRTLADHFAATVEAALARIAARDPAINAVTRLLPERARARAARLDVLAAAERPSGPLAGLPFLAKDLFDVAGLATHAGAEVRAAAAPAHADAPLIRRLEAAGAILIGTTNMDAFAYGFATENAWTGRTHNPHDLARMAGGSSGGSAAAVAAGMVPLALGSDTNGSIRVPASLCGLYGLKPTHGRLGEEGLFPFAESFDDAGPFTATLADMEAFWQAATGEVTPPADAPLKAARLVGWFADGLEAEVASAIDAFAQAIGAPEVTWPGAAAARSGAFLMTAAEGGALHHAALAAHAARYDPAVRDRLLAGALLPARDYLDAVRLRRQMRATLPALFAEHDVLIAPATPAPAPRFDAAIVRIGGMTYPARSHLGLYTQAITFLGVPALAVPLLRPGRLPLGVQLIGRPGAETTLFRFARWLEAAGLIGVSPPPEP